MNTGSHELLAFGFFTLIVVIFFLVNLVGELAPAKRHQWLLGIGLGLGVIAFSLKIILIITFNALPQLTLEHFSKPANKTVAVDIISDRQTRSERELPKKQAYTWKALPEIAPFPLDNPTTLEKVALGKKLFYDTRLSADGSLSCASCHELSAKKGGSDGLPHSIGFHGQEGTRNAPTVLNAAFQGMLFWDGRARSLEDQAKGPLINPIEMGMPSFEAVQERLRDIPEYRQAFSNLFPESPSITIDNLAKAIAAYERTLITPNSPYDRFVKGDSSALSASQLRGMALFELTGCVLCHSGFNFSGASLDEGNLGYRIFPAVPDTLYELQYQLAKDLGAAKHWPNSDRGVWRIPSLRNVSRTAPYFHNGSVDSLEEAVRIMARVQLNIKLSNQLTDDQKIDWSDKNKQLSISNHQALSDNEIHDIVAFLKALDGEIPDQ